MTNLILQFVTLGASAFSFIILFFTIRKMRQPARLSRLAPFFAIGGAFITTAAYLVLVRASVNLACGSALAAFGFIVGLLQGGATRVTWRGKDMIVQRDTAYMFLWGFAFLITTLLSLTGSALLTASGILVMLFGVGATIGSNIVLFGKQLIAQPAPAIAPTTPPPSKPSALPK